MFDLQVLAFQADITRVITFMMGREKTNRPFPEIGIADAHHPLTHHGGDRTKIEKVIRIETLQSELFAYYVEKLRSTADGDGSRWTTRSSPSAAPSPMAIRTTSGICRS